jgi:hypothetical protein
MATTNDITGDAIQTKNVSDNYRDGWDRIFGKKKNAVIDDIGSFTPEQHDATGEIVKAPEPGDEK